MKRKKMLVADLLCGAGGSSTGAMLALRDLGLEMELVCLNHWQTAIDTHTINHPKARHYCQDISTVRPHICVPEGYLDLLMASPSCTHHSVARGGKPTSDQQRSDPWHIITWLTELRVKRMIIENVWEFCFPPETAVLSKRGIVPIGSLQLGDEVWTHNARWKPVTAISRSVKDTVRVSGYGNSIIETTPDHKFYARQIAPHITVSGKNGRHESRLLEPEWVKAGELAKVDESTSYTKARSGYCWATPKELPRYWQRMPRSLGVDTTSPAFFYMLGRWLGDGWIKKRSDRQDVVRICANLQEADDLGRLLAETGLSWHRAKHSPSVQIFNLSAASSKKLIRWLCSNFGEYAHAKTLPAWIYGATEEQRWALVEGYHDADGHERKDGVVTSSSVSRCLTTGMKLLLQSLGIAASISRLPARQALGPNKESMMECRETFLLSWRREVEFEKCDRRDLHIWGRVRSVEPCRSSTEVIDITVADDHSFIADGQVVHNCKWGPVDARTGKPVKSRQGEYFNAWITVIRSLGFEPEWHKLNAADFGDATTRQRFILMARNDRKRVLWPVPTHAKAPDGNLALFPGTKPWKPTREIIDWGIKGKSIFGRPKPLAPKTLARIYAGALKFGWPQPFIDLLIAEIGHSLRFHIRWAFKARNKASGVVGKRKRRALVRDLIARWRHFQIEPAAFARGGRSVEPMLVTLRRNGVGKSVDAPIQALAANGTHIALAEAVVIRTDMHGRKSPGARGVEDPLMTSTTHGGIGFAEPVIVNGRKGNQARGVLTEPVPTLDTKGGVWLAEPFVMSPNNSGAPRSVEDPLPTITTGGAGADEREGCARPMLVEPFILNRHGDRVGSGGDTRAHSIEEPAPTADTRGGGFLVEPFIATVAHGNDAGEKDPHSRRANSIDDPLGTVHGTGSAYAVVEPFVLSRQGEGAPRSVEQPTPSQVAKHSHILISPYYGEGSGQTCNNVEEPLPTVTAKARFGMVVPVTQKNGGPGARDVETDPLATMTTAKGGEFGLVIPVTHEGGQNRAINPNETPLPTITGANRGELAFIAAQFGEREGQSPRVHDIDAPLPVGPTLGQGVLVEPTQQYDILFRMLEPHELAAAMGFNSEEVNYEFAGTKTEKIKQIGNAVSVAKMKACVAAIMADAAPKREVFAEAAE